MGGGLVYGIVVGGSRGLGKAVGGKVLKDGIGWLKRSWIKGRLTRLGKGI